MIEGVGLYLMFDLGTTVLYMPGSQRYQCRVRYCFVPLPITITSRQFCL